MMKNSLLLLLITLLAACSQPRENEYYQQLKLREEGVLRGIHIKDGEDVIRAAENEQYLEVNEHVFLKYDYPFDATDKAKGRYEIEYYLDGEDQLHEMILNVFIPDKEQAAQLYARLAKEFTEKYGASEKNKEGYSIWKGNTANTNELEVALINDSDNNESTGYLTLQINDFDY